MRGALKPFPSILQNFRLNSSSANPSSFSPLSSLVQRAERGNSVSWARIKFRGSSSLSSAAAETLLEYERDQLYDNEKVIKKDETLRLALSQLASDFDRESRLSMHRFFRTRCIPVISTGSVKLDLALGIGGLPKGRMVEIYGREASGKTTLALHIIKEAQKLGAETLLEYERDQLYDNEKVIKKDKTLRLALSQLASDFDRESRLSMHRFFRTRCIPVISTGSVKLDLALGIGGLPKVAALVPQCELDCMIDIDSQDVRSQLMNRGLRKIQASLSQTQTLVIFINQITGIGISVEVMKNNLASPMKTGDLDIEFGRGIRNEAEVLEVACKHGIIMREGEGYWINRDFFKNQVEAESYLSTQNVAAEVGTALRNQLSRDHT